MCGLPAARNMPLVAGLKHPAKIQTWSMFSCCAIFKLFMTPQKTTISDKYSRRNILASDWLEPLNQAAQVGSVSERVLMPDSSRAVFMRGGAPP